MIYLFALTRIALLTGHAWLRFSHKAVFALLGCLALLGTTVLGQVSPSTGQNYIIEQSPRTAQSSISLSTGYQTVQATVSYLDGLGRPLQTVQVKGAGDASSTNTTSDIILSTTTYDVYGRLDQSFLPAPGGVGGVLRTNSQMQASGQAFYADANPYQQTVYEASPLNRPTQQWGAGQNWRSADRKQKMAYRVATNSGGTNSSVIRFTANIFSNSLYAHPEGVGNTFSYFGLHDIAIRQLQDEQNNPTLEYTDLQGRLIRRDVFITGQTLTTMYVYDVYERLAVVIPPKLYDWFVNQGPGTSLSIDPSNQTDQFKDNAYAYLYDARGRLISKHIPSAGWTELVYDTQDRLVMSQDQQDKNESGGPFWRYTRYDGLSRVAETGRLSLASSAGDLRTAFASMSNENFPSGVNPGTNDKLVVNTYDTYTGLVLSYVTSGSLASPYSTSNGKGLLTGTQVKNLSTTSTFYSSVYWYDDKGRIVQQQNQNHLGGVDRTDNLYQFNGELLQTVLLHQKTSGGATTPVSYTYTNDHMGRPTQLTYKFGSDATKPLVLYSYDGIGRLQQKAFEPSGYANSTIVRNGSVAIPTQDIASKYVEITTGGASPFDVNAGIITGGYYDARIGLGTALQTLDYRYHIRGGLRGINVDANGQPVLDALRKDVFAFGLDYETAGYYNGNIGRQRWLASRQPTVTRQYSYSYDEANRLLSAAYSGAAGENYSLSGMSYDRNGNITSLTRVNIDQLIYSYGPGNSLTAVSDGSSNTAGFIDGNTTGTDYAYWPDGSLKKDLNRSITDIQYNSSKLPRQISFSNGKLVSYIYSADGRKLRMNSSTGEVRDYIGPFQYLNGNLFEVAHEEGRVAAGSPNTYEYFQRDHLGNIRAVISNDGSGGANVSQWVDYDPWGLELSGLSSGSSTNRQKFNDKERLAELGSGVLDYGARLYDATIGRLHTVDRASELFAHVSGYSYGLNNPIFNIDPTGDTTVPYQEVTPDKWHSFDTNTNEIGLSVVTVKGTANSGSSNGGWVGSSGGWLYDEAGRRLNRDGSPYFDANDPISLNLFIQPKSEDDEWVDWADNILTMFSPAKALKGLFIFSKVNPTSRAIAAKSIAEKATTRFTPAIRFGNDANQVHHVFRHMDKIGLNRGTVESAVRANLSRIISQVEPGKPFNRVIEVEGQRIQYTAFKLSDGTINVGRIHGAP